MWVHVFTREKRQRRRGGGGGDDDDDGRGKVERDLFV